MLLFIGRFKPPMSGQSVATQSLLDNVSAVTPDVETIDISGDVVAQNTLHETGRLGRFAAALRRAGVGGYRSFYCTVNGNVGMYLTATLAGLARARGAKIFLHHHTSSHLTRSRPAMRLLDRLAGPGATHIVVCEYMGDQLRATYRRSLRSLPLSNVGFIDRGLLDLPLPRPATRNLGFMSYVSVEKGIARAIDAFSAARDQGLADRLIVAGTIADDASARAVEEARARFGDAFDYRGNVYGADKARFFQDIDLFLFPSLFPNETQGIVNLEALAAGVPVVAFGQCCIPSDLAPPEVGPAASLVVDVDADFTAAAVAFLGEISPNLNARRTSARARFDHLLDVQRTQLAVVIEAMTGTA